jgi:hypothetical protein
VVAINSGQRCYNHDHAERPDILPRVTNVEDSTVERKIASDLRDVVKAAVVFSNSLPLGESGIIYVGFAEHDAVEPLFRIRTRVLDNFTGLPQHLWRWWLRVGVGFTVPIIEVAPSAPRICQEVELELSLQEQ